MARRTRTLEFIRWALGLSLPALESLVLVRLAEHADDDARCWPGIERLAEKTQLGRRTIYRALAALEGEGKAHIERISMPGGLTGFKLCTEARAAVLELPLLPEDSGEGCPTGTGAPQAPVPGEARQGCLPGTEGGAPQARRRELPLQKQEKDLQEHARAREDQKPLRQESELLKAARAIRRKVSGG